MAYLLNRSWKIFTRQHDKHVVLRRFEHVEFRVLIFTEEERPGQEACQEGVHPFLGEAACHVPSCPEEEACREEHPGSQEEAFHALGACREEAYPEEEACREGEDLRGQEAFQEAFQVAYREAYRQEEEAYQGDTLFPSGEEQKFHVPEVPSASFQVHQLLVRVQPALQVPVQQEPLEDLAHQGLQLLGPVRRQQLICSSCLPKEVCFLQ